MSPPVTDDDEVRKHYEIVNAPNCDAHDAALAAARAHRKAVVESSPEVAALRARVAELEAAAKPKARDESVPPPGWILWWKDGDEQTPENIERADRAMRDGPLVTAIPIAQAWRFYDREHGYAPEPAMQARVAELEAALHTVCRAIDDLRIAVRASRRLPWTPVEMDDQLRKLGLSVCRLIDGQGGAT